MKKYIKHIWKYITDSNYRVLIDLIGVSKQYEDAFKAIQENAMRASHPIFRVESKVLTDIKINGYSYKTLNPKTNGIIHNNSGTA